MTTTYFFIRGYSLLKQNGQLSFITSNKYLRAKYGTGLRKFLSKKVTLATIIDFGDLPLFNAAAYPCILLAQKALPNRNTVTTLAVSDIELIEQLKNVVNTHGCISMQSDLDENNWQIVSSNHTKIIQTMTNNVRLLGEYINHRFYRGIVTGSNEAFVVNQSVYDELISADGKNREIIKPWLRGRDISRWKVNSENLYVLYIPWDFPIQNYPSVLKHLEKFHSVLGSRPEVNEGRYPWYALSRYGSEFTHEFSHAKIMYPHFSPKPNFAYDESASWGNDKVYIIPEASHFLLGVLNSNATYFFLKNITPAVRGVPVPNAVPELHEKIAALARQCLDAAKSSPDRLPALESALNQAVYQAYGLDADDIRVIEGYLSGQKSGGEAVEITDEAES